MDNKKLSYVFGALLIAFGVIFIMSPKDVFESIVLFGGIAVIAFSVIGILTSIFGKDTGSSYFLGSSILGLILGIVLISNKASAVNIIPIFLGIWLFVSGFSTTVFMSKAGSSLTSMTAPITRMILGLICFSSPIIPISIAGIFIGIVLVCSGINIITNVKNEDIIYKVKIKK
ncbi:MAG: DUF308 domain-containing protein [Bacilli bacterium]|nr:DUF308 domain-containing protein [Bacilli bacterium]